MTESDIFIMPPPPCEMFPPNPITMPVLAVRGELKLQIRAHPQAKQVHVSLAPVDASGKAPAYSTTTLPSDCAVVSICSEFSSLFDKDVNFGGDMKSVKFVLRASLNKDALMRDGISGTGDRIKCGANTEDIVWALQFEVPVVGEEVVTRYADVKRIADNFSRIPSFTVRNKKDPVMEKELQLALQRSEKADKRYRDECETIAQKYTYSPDLRRFVVRND